MKQLIKSIFILLMSSFIFFVGCASSDDDSSNATADSDNDGLTDIEEITVYFSNPADEDTDGDGYLDGEEVVKYAFDINTNRYRFNPTIADVPQFTLKITSAPTVTAYWTPTEGSSTQQSFSRQETNTESASITRGTQQSNQLEASISNTVGMSVTIGAQPGATFSGETTVGANYVHSWAFNWDMSQSWETSISDTEGYETVSTQSDTFDFGTISVTTELYNEGYIDFRVDNVQISVVEDSPFIQDNNSPVTTLQGGAGSDAFVTTTLRNGQSIPNVIFTSSDSTQLDYTTTMRLLQSSKNLIFTPTTYTLMDENGTGIDMNMDTVNGKTARITIDFGVSDQTPKQYYVATRRNSNNPGITLEQALDVLAIDYSIDPVEWSLDPSTDHARTTTYNGITRIDSFETSEEITSYWVIFISANNGYTTTNSIHSNLISDYSLGNIILNAGNDVRILYMKDEDKDLIPIREEILNGCSDKLKDSDGDGITDYNELRVGWYVNGKIVYSDPAVPDTDRDDLTDMEERGFCDVSDDGSMCLYNGEQLIKIDSSGDVIIPTETELGLLGIPYSTNPNKKDTDDDMLLDKIDKHPLTFDTFVSLENFVVSDSSDDGLTLEWTNPSDTSTYDGVVIVRHSFIYNMFDMVPDSQDPVTDYSGGYNFPNSADTSDCDGLSGQSWVACMQVAVQKTQSKIIYFFHGALSDTSVTDVNLNTDTTYYYTAYLYKGDPGSVNYFDFVAAEGKTTSSVTNVFLDGQYRTLDNRHLVKINWTNPVSSNFQGIVILRGDESFSDSELPSQTPDFYVTAYSGDKNYTDLANTNNTHTKVIYASQGDGIGENDFFIDGEGPDDFYTLDSGKTYYYAIYAYTEGTDPLSYSSSRVRRAYTFRKVTITLNKIGTSNADSCGSTCELYWNFVWKNASGNAIRPNGDDYGAISQFSCSDTFDIPKNTPMGLSVAQNNSAEFYFDYDVAINNPNIPLFYLAFPVREKDSGCDSLSKIRGQSNSGDDDSFGMQNPELPNYIQYFVKSFSYNQIQQGDFEDALYWIYYPIAMSTSQKIFLDYSIAIE